MVPAISKHVALDSVRTPNFLACWGDSVEILRDMPDDSLHFICTSLPFLALYTYSASDRDMGNCRSDAEFWQHYQFLATELMRVLKPGRLMAIHCMTIPTSKQHHGYIGLQDFRGDVIRAHQKDGMIYHSEVCIWKDPVVAVTRTKALGLLHKQLLKDSSMSRQGVPDYLVVLRKPGVNEEPITGRLTEFVGEMSDAEFTQLCRRKFFERSAEDTGYAMSFEDFKSVMIWQRYASPVWFDINPSDTLQRESARAEQDERHIAPLQLQVIRRALQLWTMPNEIVLDPFGGIGSTPYEAVRMGRRGISVELKESYYHQLVLNCQRAEKEPREQPGLFDESESAPVETQDEGSYFYDF